ncbi:MAG: 30S ribosomal protein S12 methylthiotransferase RimO [Eubacteriales bacterium]|nr:30S ribosomal protein S12 methylthiotransferase RimO [Eubacteriales bacterium]
MLTKVAIASLGCAKNTVDTENMLGIIQKGGFEIVSDEKAAEVIIVNTCCFINDAKEESINTILELARLKEEGSLRRLVVTGCMAQRYKDEILKEMPEVDAVVGLGHISDILSAISGEGENIMADRPYSHPASERIRITPPYSAYLKIADGCDNHCTYCVIPSIRGKYNSRPLKDLVAEAKALAQKGVSELIIIAQDTTSYGIDLYGKVCLTELLKELCKIDGIRWIRLHYCYPERMTDEIVELIATEDKICKYIDMPIQHCNDDILSKMGRKGSRAKIIEVIKKLRRRIPGITIRTTLITGFPTETDEQYLEMLDFVEEMKFERLGVFAYSQEEGTPAANMQGQIDEEVKSSRLEMIMLKQAEVSQAVSERKVGKTIEVLTEGYDSFMKRYYGRSQADSVDIDGKVFFTCKKRIKEGSFVKVFVEGAMDYDLFGRVEE